MKWEVLLAGSLLILGLLISLPISQTNLESAVEPAESPDGILQIDDSTVNYVFPDHIETGTPFDICFHTTVNTPDLEYMDRLQVDMPDDWTVHQVYVEPKSSGCLGDTVAGIETGNVIYWQTDQTMPTGCGPWYNGSYDFCANVTAPDCTGEPWYLWWTIYGDGYGGDPHNITGSTNPISCEYPSTLYVSPNTYFIVGCHTVTHTLSFNLDNQTGYTDTFDVYYDVFGGRATISGPDQIYLGDGVDQDFVVDLTAKPCLPAGTEISATIQAAGGGMYSGAFIWMTTTYGGSCPVCNETYLPLVLRSD